MGPQHVHGWSSWTCPRTHLLKKIAISLSKWVSGPHAPNMLGTCLLKENVTSLSKWAPGRVQEDLALWIPKRPPHDRARSSKSHKEKYQFS